MNHPTAMQFGAAAVISPDGRDRIPDSLWPELAALALLEPDPELLETWIRRIEDRLRQEWVTFKADDQKRWTGFSLSQEESMRDMRKDMDRVEERVTSLDDAAQTLQDQMHQTTDVTEKQLHELMNSIHEWTNSYQRIMGHGKKTTKKSAK